MAKNMESTIMGYIDITIRIHSFIPSLPKVRFGSYSLFRVLVSQL